MPVYTYRCDSCGTQFERHQSFNDAPLKTCPECRKKSLRKVITPTRVIFKGSGFYATDNRSPSGDHGKSGDNGKPAATDTKPEKKPESKAAEPKKGDKSE
jgi:putative FmdB family regulatory protein